jgi:hypothetical protein
MGALGLLDACAACRLTNLRISCGRNARISEFYGPLIANGGRR